jgi:hypothetical protein
MRPQQSLVTSLSGPPSNLGGSTPMLLQTSGPLALWTYGPGAGVATAGAAISIRATAHTGSVSSRMTSMLNPANVARMPKNGPGCAWQRSKGGLHVDRDEAAALLGVPADASAEAVKRAWRVWARLAHPDAGGDPRSFAELDQARRVLLRPRPPSFGLEPAPRLPWRAVLTRPAHPILLGLGAGVAVLLAIVPAFTALPVVLAAAPAFIAATAWAVFASRALIAPRADHGHRITALALLWLPIAAAQVGVSIIAGVSLIAVLPLSALPLAAAVAAVNPGAGLWRPVSDGGPHNG